MRSLVKVIPKGHGKYSIGRFKADPTLANTIGCVYLAKVPVDGIFYLKIGISKYLEASERKKSLPKGTVILKYHHTELHKCFQAEQVMLTELKQEELVIHKFSRFEGYSELLTLMPDKSSLNKVYFLRLKSALKETKSYDEFINN